MVSLVLCPGPDGPMRLPERCDAAPVRDRLLVADEGCVLFVPAGVDRIVGFSSAASSWSRSRFAFALLCFVLGVADVGAEIALDCARVAEVVATVEAEQPKSRCIETTCGVTSLPQTGLQSGGAQMPCRQQV